MEKKLYLVDTCVFIGAIRGDTKSLKILKDIREKIVFSVITEMELYVE